MKYLCVLIALASVCFDLSGQNQDTTICKLVDIEPAFEYKLAKSTQESVLVYVKENIKYPAILCDTDISGKVFVEFIVELDGYLSNFRVIRGIDDVIDNASIDVLKTMSNWKAAKKDNKEVRAWTSVYVVWSLN